MTELFCESLTNAQFDHLLSKLDVPMLSAFNQFLSIVNGIIWHPWVILILLCVGLLFTIWTRFCQRKSLTHGLAVVRGKYDNHDDPGAISHFQALSSALSATVGVGNIGGTALAIAIGGPGALFWMWIVGLLGMALKMMEVTLSMLYRNTQEDGGVSGGPMWVVQRGLTDASPRLRPFTRVLSGLFCVTLLIATFTGGLFFQAWNASNVTQQFFGIPAMLVGAILMVIVGLVILGGITRIGRVASRIVPFMCGVYLLAGVYVLAINLGSLPQMLSTIFYAAFSTTESSGAFVGGTFGSVFAIGMQQAFFSNEAGQGSSPIVHSAVKTDQPVREGIVAGLEPFIDTIVVCTMTGLVILLSGVWNRTAEYEMAQIPSISRVDQEWIVEPILPPPRTDRSWIAGDSVFCLIRVGEPSSPQNLQQLPGSLVTTNGQLRIQWQPISGEMAPVIESKGLFQTYAGASLTALAFDQAHPGLGKWLVTIGTWLFGISTMISWSYYGEQGVRFLFGPRFITPYRLVFCAAIFLSCLGLIRSQTELTHLANLGTGVMLWVNVPITILFSHQVVAAYNDYIKRINAPQ